MAFSLKSLPPWALYGGAGLTAGGGYLLYKKHEASKAAAAGTSITPTSLDASGTTATDASAQQAGIVPYYLTAGSGQATGTSTSNGGRRHVPQTTQTAIPPTTISPIPPLMPVASGGNAPTASKPGVAETTLAPTAPGAPATGGVPVVQNTPSAPTVTNLPSDVLQKIQANGEQLIGDLIDPVTGGTWWFGSKGGVFAAGGARFLGSVPSVGAFFPGFQAVGATPVGNGYRIVNSQGQVYNFAG